MLIPKPRGPLSEVLFGLMSGAREDWDLVADLEPDGADDAHVALWAMYELHHQGLDHALESMEWHPPLLAVRRRLETAFEAELRSRVTAPTVGADFATTFFSYVAGHDGLSLAAHVQRRCDREQLLELLRWRSVYHLKESDATAWVVPRLTTRPKAALSAVLFDEYGAGDPNRLHAHLFALGMSAAGLSAEYGAYVDDAPAEILEQNNAMSLFGLHRRLRGAALGHLAAFEATSSMPARRIAQGLARLGMPQELVDYYDEHVLADAAHEQQAVRDICGPLVADEPALTDDVFLGAFSCLDLEDRVARRALAEWGVDD
ncbi:iron-containing redox enzyme family protein [Nocardioides sp. HDW12B]|uniref:iron-containing redox enzyme family protein n=1 Tax=Nocardioides sp. HDW12B TaxID=2714939 RepID=UPI001409689A|nr:iron-containing redox enzyme family protein [Nocardioides sp. HDW12B]QIK68100.1 iron-containing redox enzyme family protein [Nocardioides sp. HDW12B]